MGVRTVTETLEKQGFTKLEVKKNFYEKYKRRFFFDWPNVKVEFESLIRKIKTKAKKWEEDK